MKYRSAADRFFGILGVILFPTIVILFNTNTYAGLAVILVLVFIAAFMFYMTMKQHYKDTMFVREFHKLSFRHVHTEFLKFRDLYSVPNTDKTNVYYMNKEKMDLFEELVYVLVNHEKAIINARRFLEVNRTSSEFYKKIFIYSLYFLLNNDIDQFVSIYGEYDAHILTRPESRVLNEQLNVFQISREKVIIDGKLIQLLYEFYSKNKDIEPEIFQIYPKTKLDEMIYILLLKNYLVQTENDTMLADFEHEYNNFVEIRKMLR